MAAIDEPRTTQVLYDPWLRRYSVTWWGTQHGGDHPDLEDALEHADALEASEDWDHANWREMTGRAEFEP